MSTSDKSGNELCYPERRTRVSSRAFDCWPMSEPVPMQPTKAERLLEERWIIWGRSVFALSVVALLLVLGVANVAMRAQRHHVEDGVLWTMRAEGVTAAEIAAGSPAEAAGIQRGDLLVA